MHLIQVKIFEVNTPTAFHCNVLRHGTEPRSTACHSIRQSVLSTFDVPLVPRTVVYFSSYLLLTGGSA